MSTFDQLHPSVQHHVVNSLGWRSLRPLQEHAIEPIFQGKNCLLLAPTAGGKTEAAVFPILSRMLEENWSGLSVLYVCPIRALLNNLEERLSFYGGLVGRTCGLWHGDVSQATKSRTLNEPPDILLTTPESLEALLISRRTDRAFFFGSVRVIVVDEIHAFVGDDRGWHLLAVLERIKHITSKDTQRIGLSATVGNPEKLLEWLCTGSKRESIVVAPPAPNAAEAEVTIDYVGNLPNAARVLRAMHHGEKRLVFCDSRARTEELATYLRAEGVSTFVSHSSLSVEERRAAEQAFREARDCVIVATSTLELGIDVGDLDRVIQIDAPATVASFLQRLGRTGRRAGVLRNCLFLTTSRESLLRASALVDLWRSGYVETVSPPEVPFHVVAQQLMNLVLQLGGLGRRAWREWIRELLGPMGISEDDVGSTIDHMLAQQILAADGDILGMGPEGERLYGARHFMTLLSVFDSPPLFTVFCGPKDLGVVHPISFRQRDGELAILSLGGRSWQVVHVDFDHKTAQVVPSEYLGRSRWLGESRPLSYEMCQTIRRVLLGGGPKDVWSKRANTEMELALEEPFVAAEAIVVQIDRGRDRTTWWTFAGLLANAELSKALRGRPIVDNLSITVNEVLSPEHLREIQGANAESVERAIPDADQVKFHECVPEDLLARTQRIRLSDLGGVNSALRSRMIFRSNA